MPSRCDPLVCATQLAVALLGAAPTLAMAMDAQAYNQLVERVIEQTTGQAKAPDRATPSFGSSPPVATPGKESVFRVAAKELVQPVFPQGINYAIQAQRILQRHSNPYRLPDSAGDQRKGDTAVADEIRVAANVPLLSERTRLQAAAALGNVRYHDQRQLDHQPHYLKAALQWHGGDLLQGTVSVSERTRLNRYLATSWPQRDLIKQRLFSADVGLRVSESLTLPMVSVSRSASRNEFASNQMLYNRDDTRLQLAGRYVGIDNSYVMMGVSQSRSRYPDRTVQQIQQLDQSFTDREYFVNGAWHYSAKTAFETYLGWRRRAYTTLVDRDVDLLTAEMRAYWDYSSKTSLHAHLWHRPFGNEEDPGTLYSTLTGGRLSARWQAGEKTWVSLNVVREQQKNYRSGSGDRSESQAWRWGPRLEWQVHPNVSVVLDGWRERVRGDGSQGYGGTVVRVSVVLNHDNGYTQPAKLFLHAECDAPRYLDTRLCDQ